MAYDPNDVARKIVMGRGWDSLEELKVQVEVALAAAFRAGKAQRAPIKYGCGRALPPLKDFRQS